MHSHFMRILTAVVSSAVAFYLLSVLSYVLLLIATGTDPRAHDFVTFSPLTIVILVAMIPAGSFGLVSGGLIVTFWRQSTSAALRTSALVATGALFFWALSRLPAVFDTSDTQATVQGWIGFAVVAWLICFAAHALSIAITKRLTTNPPS